MTRYPAFILAVGLAASSAAATLTAGFGVITDGDSNPVFDGYVVQDLYVSTTPGDVWGTAQILTNLDTGTFYQHPSPGNDYAPNPALFDLNPGLEFDSYVDGNGSQPVIITTGGAVNLGGSTSTYTFSDTDIDLTWYSIADNQGDMMKIGRFTASNDANGSWQMLVSSTSGFRSYEGSIVDGEFDLRISTGGEPIPGDLNEDQYVGLDDLQLILGDWNKQVFTGDPLQIGDLTLDGIVGLDDLQIVLNNWGQYVFPGDTSVGDLSGNGQIGLDDLQPILDNWNYQIQDVDPRSDPTADGYVGLDDLQLILDNWNTGTPPTPTTTIPEPATAALLLLSLLFPNRQRT